jgi:hypothetical protein
MGSDTHTAETPTLLRNKLHRPRLADDAIHRSHLLERQNRGFQRSATLISAPAGFGKTTLIGSWLLGIGDWGLDNAHSPQSPLTNNQSPITASQTPPLEYLTTTLVNEIAELTETWLRADLLAGRLWWLRPSFQILDAWGRTWYSRVVGSWV